MPSRAELVAHGRTPDEIATAIGADLVIFQTLPDLVAAVRQLNPSIPAFDCSVFTGEYVTGGVDAAYLSGLEALRADNVKRRMELGGLGTMEGKGGGAAVSADAVGVNGAGADSTVGLHNSWSLQ